MTRDKMIARVRKLYRLYWPAVRLFDNSLTMKEIAAMPDGRLADFLAETERQAARVRGADRREALVDAVKAYAEVRAARASH